MLMTDFEEWIKEENLYTEREVFEEFFNHWADGMTMKDIFQELAWQIYNLQSCVEGLIEDTV